MRFRSNKFECKCVVYMHTYALNLNYDIYEYTGITIMDMIKLHNLCTFYTHLQIYFDALSSDIAIILGGFPLFLPILLRSLFSVHEDICTDREAKENLPAAAWCQ